MDQAELEKLRAEALADVEIQAKKERFDVFSHPPPLCVGDSSYKRALPPRDPEQPTVPKTDKRGIFTSPGKHGQGPENYLDGSFLKVIVGKESNPYVDPTKLKMGLVTATGQSIATKEKREGGGKPFYPAVNKWNIYTGSDQSGNFKRMGAPFSYVDSKEGKKVLTLPKDTNGKQIVPIKTRNIQAAAIHPGHYASTIGHTINKFPEYKEQGYNQLAKNEFKEREKWNKVYEEKHGGKKFKIGSHPLAVINSDKNLYQVPEHLLKSAASTSVSHRVKGSNSDGDDRKAFRPSNPMKSGEGGYITSFIRLEPLEKPTGPLRKRGNSAEEERKAFKPSRGYKSRPTPSITLHMSNIRSSLAR